MIREGLILCDKTMADSQEVVGREGWDEGQLQALIDVFYSRTKTKDDCLKQMGARLGWGAELFLARGTVRVKCGGK